MAGVDAPQSGGAIGFQHPAASQGRHPTPDPVPAGRQSVWRERPAGHLAGRPEGPYETSDLPYSLGVSSRELLQCLDFVEQLDAEAGRALSIHQGNGELRLLTVLMRNHLRGKLTTSTTLVGSSGLSYGTGMRKIASIEERGLLSRRPRTRSGKSFSLHPTEKLIGEWQEFARRTRSLMGSTFGHGVTDPDTGYYFGSSFGDGHILPLPSILEEKLSLSRGLRMLVHADPTFMAMHALKKQFEAIFGVEIKNRAFSIDRLREEILANASESQSRYDIVACDLPWFGEMAHAGHFLPLDDLMRDCRFDASDLHGVAMASSRYRGRQYGIPIQTTPELLVCRSDVLERLGLEPPQTVEETLVAARAAHRPLHGMAGIAWNAARGTPLGHSFMFVSAAFGQPILDLQRTDYGYDGENVYGESLRPMLDSPEARETAEYFLRLLEFSPPGILNMSWYERARCYGDGDVAIAYCATLLAPLFETNPMSPAYGNTVYLAHPSGRGSASIAPLGGYALAIPSNVPVERIKPVWTALELLASAPAVKLYIKNGSLVSPRFSVSMDPEVRRISPLISIVDEMARRGIVQMWPRPPVPEITDLIAIIGTEMHDLLRGAQSVDDALSRSQNRADALMRAHGHY